MTSRLAGGGERKYVRGTDDVAPRCARWSSARHIAWSGAGTAPPSLKRCGRRSILYGTRSTSSSALTVRPRLEAPVRVGPLRIRDCLTCADFADSLGTHNCFATLCFRAPASDDDHPRTACPVPLQLTVYDWDRCVSTEGRHARLRVAVRCPSLLRA